MRVAATYEIPVTGACHCMPIFRVVHREYSSPCQIQTGVHPVVMDKATVYPRQGVKRTRISKIVSMNEMQRQSGGHRQS